MFVEIGAFGGSQANLLSPNARIMSPEDLAKDGPERGTILVARVLSIKQSEKDENANLQQRFKTNRGQIKSVGYQRKIMFMCVNSKSGSNVFIMFQGNGNNPRIFDFDASLRDNGTLRECFISFVFSL